MRNASPNEAILEVIIVNDSIHSVIYYRPRSGEKESTIPTGRSTVVIDLGYLELNAGRYSLIISLFDSRHFNHLIHLRGVMSFRVTANERFWGNIVRYPSLKFISSFEHS